MREYKAASGDLQSGGGSNCSQTWGTGVTPASRCCGRDAHPRITRLGAGRPPRHPDTRRVQVSISLPQPVAGKLKEERNRSQFVEAALVEKWARDEDQPETEEDTP